MKTIEYYQRVRKYRKEELVDIFRQLEMIIGNLKDMQIIEQSIEKCINIR